MTRHVLAATAGLLCAVAAGQAAAEALPAAMDRYDCGGTYTQSVSRAGQATTGRFRFGVIWNTETLSMAFIGSVPMFDDAYLLLPGQFASTVSADGAVHFPTGAIGPEKSRGDFVLDTAGKTLSLTMTWPLRDTSGGATLNSLTLKGVCVQNRTWGNLQDL